MTLILLPFKLAYALTTLPLRIARIPLKILGFRGTLGVAAGVGIGLLVAPRRGQETWQMLQERWNGGPATPWQPAPRAAGEAASAVPGGPSDGPQ